MASGMNWDQAGREGRAVRDNRGPRPTFDLDSSLTRKREALAALDVTRVDFMTPEQVNAAYAALTDEQRARANDIRRGNVAVAPRSSASGAAAKPRAPKKPRKLSPKQEIQARKDLIAKVAATPFADRGDAYDQAAAEFDRLDASAVEALKAKSRGASDSELVKTRRSHDEWRRRLDDAR